MKLTLRNFSIVLIIVFFFNLIKTYYFSLFYANLNFFDFLIANEAGDTFSYLIPIDNYINEGSYYATKHGIKYYAIRPPHYMILYYFFNVFGLAKTTIFSMMVLFQIAFHSLSVVLISLAVSNIFNKKKLFYFCLIFMLMSSNISYLNMFIIPESIVISLVSISIYFYSKYINFKNVIYLIICTFCIALAAQLRPYIMLGLIIPFATILYFFYLKRSIKSFVKDTVLLLFVLLIVIGPWTYRNYKIYGVIAPYDYKILDYYYNENYNNSVVYNKRQLLSSQGEGDIFWDIDCMSSFFEDSTSEFKKNSRVQFSDYNFCKGLTMKEYEESRVLYLNALNNPKDSIIKNKAKQYFHNLTSIYTKEKPLNFYIFSPLKMIGKSIFHKGTFYLPFTLEQANSNFLLKIWKYSEFILYQFLLFFSIIGIFFSFLNKNKYLILLLFPISCILTMYLIRGNEYRYFGISYPVLYIFASYGIFLSFNSLLKFKNFIIRKYL
jgi:hypothetical protein